MKWKKKSIFSFSGFHLEKIIEPKKREFPFMAGHDGIKWTNLFR